MVSGALASTTLRGFHATVGGIHIGRIDTIFTVSAALIMAAGIYGAYALPQPKTTNGQETTDLTATEQAAATT